MSLKPNTQRFIKALQDTTSRIQPIYRRNFRELLKLIPVVGSWLDANTMGAIQDTILTERLDNLEMACMRALSIEDGEVLYAELTNINSIFFVILFTNLTEISQQTHQITTDVSTLLAIVQEDQKRFEPHPNFRFVTISGPSAAGKDCILDLILYWKGKSRTHIEALTKFTTRPKRVIDSKYYDFVTDEQFDVLDKSGNIIFPYYKRDARYGFDRTHLFNAAREDQVAFCVFTHFESLPTDRQFLQSQGIRHIAILLTADRDSLVIRSDERPLKPDDIAARKISIESDLQFLADNQSIIRRCFDLVVYNGDAYSKRDAYNRIVRCVGLPEMAVDIDDIR